MQLTLLVMISLINSILSFNNLGQISLHYKTTSKISLNYNTTNQCIANQFELKSTNIIFHRVDINLSLLIIL